LGSCSANDRLRHSRTFRHQYPMSATSLEATFKFPISALQRLPSVAAGSWVHGAWHEAVIGLPCSAAASMTGIEGAAVIQLGRPQVPLQIAVERQLLKWPNSRCRPVAAHRPCAAKQSFVAQTLAPFGPEQHSSRKVHLRFASAVLPAAAGRTTKASISTTTMSHGSRPQVVWPDHKNYTQHPEIFLICRL
jgi:hypothetical protein